MEGHLTGNVDVLPVSLRTVDGPPWAPEVATSRLSLLSVTVALPSDDSLAEDNSKRDCLTTNLSIALRNYANHTKRHSDVMVA